LLTAYFSRQN